MSAERRDTLSLVRKFKIPLNELTDFSSYSNPNRTSDPTWLLFEASLEIYSPSFPEELEEAIAKFHGVEPEEVIVAGSLSEILRAIIFLFGIRRIGMEDIHSEFSAELEEAGCEIFEISPDSLEKNLDNFEVFILSNPSTVTGKLRKKEEIAEILRELSSKNLLLILDESLIEFSTSSESFSQEISRESNLIILKSLDKLFGLDGLPLGYALAQREICRALKNVGVERGVDAVRRKIYLHLLDDISGYLEESREMVEKEKRWMRFELKKLSAAFIESEANFILIDPSSFGMSSEELLETLAEEGIILRYCGNLLGIGLRSREENERLINHLRRISERSEALALRWFREISKEEKPIGPRTSCSYYPCHFESQDCTFCFCPLYPCGNERLGEFVGSGQKVWSCVRCDVVHRPEIAKELLRMMREGKNREEMLEWLISIL